MFGRALVHYEVEVVVLVLRACLSRGATMERAAFDEVLMDAEEIAETHESIRC